MISLGEIKASFFAPFLYRSTSIRPTDRMESNTDVSHIAFQTNCQATVIYIDSLLIGVTNSAKSFSSSCMVAN